MTNNIISTFSSTAWENGFTGTLQVKNEGDLVNSWELVFESEYSINQQDGEYEILGAEVISEELLTNGTYRYTITPLSYNAVLDPEESVFINFNATWFETEIPELNNIIFNAEEVEPDYEYDVDIQVNPWSGNSGATVFVDITNTGGEEIPDVELKFNSDFQIRPGDGDIWGAAIVSETFQNGEYEYVLDFLNNEDLAPGEQHSFGFNTEDYTPEFINISLNGATSTSGGNDSGGNDDGGNDDGGNDDGGNDGSVARPSYNQSTGFFTLNGKIYDANGNEFVARGLNNRHVWFDNDGTTEAIDALDNIAGFGFNSNRIVWEVDHDVNPTDAILERAIQTTIDNNMVPMVELHDFTGRNDTNDLLNRGVKWWTDRADLWQKYEESLMINIANEFGDYNLSQGSSRALFPQVYKEAINRIRGAGINNTLVIDPFHYGKDISLIAEYGREIYEHDPQQNIVFSVHFYCGEGADPNQIRDGFDAITGQGLPMVVGEFGPTHEPCGDVREDVIMAEAEAHDVGYYAWAWDDAEWRIGTHWEADSYDELTPFGRDLVYGPNGIQETAEFATIFDV